MLCANNTVALASASILLVLCAARPAAAQGSPQAPRTNPDSSGPQTAVPAPAPAGRADIPGGSASNGVIKPPAGGTMPVIPPPAAGTTPVLRPPGAAGNRTPVQPR